MNPVCGYSLVVKFLPSKQAMRVRFPLPAPLFLSPRKRFTQSCGIIFRLFRTLLGQWNTIYFHCMQPRTRSENFPLTVKSGSSSLKIYQDKSKGAPCYSAATSDNNEIVRTRIERIKPLKIGLCYHPSYLAIFQPSFFMLLR